MSKGCHSRCIIVDQLKVTKVLEVSHIDIDGALVNKKCDTNLVEKIYIYMDSLITVQLHLLFITIRLICTLCRKANTKILSQPIETCMNTLHGIPLLLSLLRIRL